MEQPAHRRGLVTTGARQDEQRQPGASRPGPAAPRLHGSHRVPAIAATHDSGALETQPHGRAGLTSRVGEGVRGGYTHPVSDDGPEPGALRASTFSIPGMDCPSEERLIRMALDPVEGIHELRFDLDGRELVVVHEGPSQPLLERLEPLGFGASLMGSERRQAVMPKTDSEEGEGRVLKQLLAINAVMFGVELGWGLYAQSTGLIADSLDMLADAGVYGLSLYAVGRTQSAKLRAAKVSGWLQAALAVGVLGEVVRRAVVGSEPVEGLMIGVASLALVANLACVALLAKHRKGGVHLEASWIFSTNDALANLGVIAAGILVWATGTAWPDLFIGTAVGLLVLWGAIRILRLR